MKFYFIGVLFSIFLYANSDFAHKANIANGGVANVFNGAVSENISTNIYKSSGYSKLSAEVGRNGVDGLYVKRDSIGNIKEVVFSEVKYNNAKLGSIKNNTIKQMSKEWKIVKIDEKIKELKNSNGNIRLINELKKIKSMVINNSPKVKSHITRIKPLGNNKYKILLNELDASGKSVKKLRFKANGKIIDINKQYAVDSIENKLKKDISHSIRKEKRLIKEKNILKKIKEKQRAYKKYPNIQKKYIKKAAAQKRKIELIKKSRPKYKLNRARATRKGFTKIILKTSKYGGKLAYAAIEKVGLLSSAKSMSSLVKGMSVTKALPFIGAFAQIAADIYMMKKINDIEKATENNKRLISENREEISRLDGEIKVLSSEVVANKENINKLYSAVFGLQDDVANLTAALLKVKNMVDKNREEIEKIKKNFYIVGMKELKIYYDSNNSDISNLQNAEHSLRMAYENYKDTNSDIKFLIINGYNISLSERVIKSENNNTKKELKKIILSNFDKLLDSNKTMLINSSFVMIKDIFKDDNNSIELINKYYKYMQKVLNSKIEKHKFDDAIYLAQIVKQNTDNNSLYNKAVEAMENNFLENKDKIIANSDNIINIIENNQNLKLVKYAIKKLYQDDKIDKMLKVLKSKYVFGDEFFIKAYYLAYKISNTNKANEIKKLILTNSSYSKALKEWIQEN